MPNGRDLNMQVLGETGADIQMTVGAGGDAAAVRAEKWANGTANGVPVPASANPNVPTSENNAKYWAQQAGQNVTDAQAEVEKAEAWANGTRSGEPVGTSDPAYHKNAKYYRELAQSDANAAAASQAAAAQSAQQAAGHVTAAETAQQAAEDAAQEAIETVVAAQGPGICYVDSNGIPFVLE